MMPCDCGREEGEDEGGRGGEEEEQEEVEEAEAEAEEVVMERRRRGQEKGEEVASRPTRPRPSTPSVLPESSTPMYFFRSHLRAFIDASPCGGGGDGGAVGGRCEEVVGPCRHAKGERGARAVERCEVCGRHRRVL